MRKSSKRQVKLPKYFDPKLWEKHGAYESSHPMWSWFESPEDRTKEWVLTYNWHGHKEWALEPMFFAGDEVWGQPKKLHTMFVTYLLTGEWPAA